MLKFKTLNITSKFVKKTLSISAWLATKVDEDGVNYSKIGSVYNFVSLLFCLIPEAGCGQSPQALINTGFPNISGK